MQEFSPASKRGWFTGITTTMLAGRSLLAALLGTLPRPYIGWRGMVGDRACCLRSCASISGPSCPKSPHWLLRQGRSEEARRSLAWALKMDPGHNRVADCLLPIEHTRWLEIFKYPRSIIAGCLTGLTQTGGVALALWLVDAVRHGAEDHPAGSVKLVIWVASARSPAGFSARGFRMRGDAVPRASSCCCGRGASSCRWRVICTMSSSAARRCSS